MAMVRSGARKGRTSGCREWRRARWTGAAAQLIPVPTAIQSPPGIVSLGWTGLLTQVIYGAVIVGALIMQSVVMRRVR